MPVSIRIATVFTCLLALHTAESRGQACCGGGGGSPIAGGATQGVLQEGQAEAGSSYQFVSTNIFFSEDRRDTATYFDRFASQYLYTRFAYGISEKFTLSLESGYWIKKTQVGLHAADTITSTGIGDLILFPRYSVFSKSTMTLHNELTLGMGMKVPLGKYNDSIGKTEPFSGQLYYLTKPQSVQNSSGANDFIFYAFYFRDYLARDFRIFANSYYIRKGWNPSGEKMGDFASLGIFAGKTFFSRLGTILQVRGEWIGKMRINKTVYLFAYPNYDPEATGSRKVFITPQVSYSWRKLTLFALADLPVYQYCIKSQAGSQHQFSAGLNYRFMLNNSCESVSYVCPMHPEVTSDSPSKCPKCGMDLEKQKNKDK